MSWLAERKSSKALNRTEIHGDGMNEEWKKGTNQKKNVHAYANIKPKNTKLRIGHRNGMEIRCVCVCAHGKVERNKA